MERSEEENGSVIPFDQYYSSEFGLVDEANLDDLIDLIIQGENTEIEHQPILNVLGQDYGYCRGDDESNVRFPPPPPAVELFKLDAGHELGLLKNIEAEEEELVVNEKEASGKAERSKTLVSERRRRGRMKEKLYALRSLVPNITKMDKASIVGDAVLYVQDLQMQARKIRTEIAAIEDKTTQTGNKSDPTCFYPTTKKISKMDVSQVEERGFYVRIVGSRGEGVAALLFRALESLTTFNIRSSTLAASADHNYVFTFTLHMLEAEMDVSLQSVKVWIASVFLNFGFHFQT